MADYMSFLQDIIQEIEAFDISAGSPIPDNKVFGLMLIAEEKLTSDELEKLKCEFGRWRVKYAAETGELGLGDLLSQRKFPISIGQEEWTIIKDAALDFKLRYRFRITPPS